ncbi:hypothetical protein Aperf_G00000058676 [Anoplocephala perfoliata]
MPDQKDPAKITFFHELMLYVSWSPKGKQLALAVTGPIKGGTPAPTSGNMTSIVQVDPDLKVKRIIPLGDLLKDRLKDFNSPQPTDILWTSSYCFLLGVEDTDPSKGNHLVFITALQKSETRLNRLPDFTSLSTSNHRYHLRLVPNSVNLVAVTWSQDAEECFLLNVPAISTSAESPPPDTLPQLITPLPLPTDGSPIAMDIGALLDAPDTIPMVLGLLNNGAIFAFKISPPSGEHSQSPLSGIFARFKLWCGSADKPPQLPAAANAAPDVPFGNTSNTPVGANASSFGSMFGKPPVIGGPATNITSAKSEVAIAGHTPSTSSSPLESVSGFTGLASSAPAGKTSGLLFMKPFTSDTASGPSPAFAAFGPPFSMPPSPDAAVKSPIPVSAAPKAEPNPATSSAETAAGFPPRKPVTIDSTPASAAASSFANSLDSTSGKPTSAGTQRNLCTMILIIEEQHTKIVTYSVKDNSKTVPLQQSPSRARSPASPGKTAAARDSVPMTQSIIDAATQFARALKSQAETSARAWDHLHEVFEGNSKNLQQAIGKNGDVRRGVWDIEQSLANMDDFLQVIDEITSQLKKASQISVTEQKESSDFLDHLSDDFDVFSQRMSDNHLAMISAGLDPEAANMLAALKRKSRAAEGCLIELEDQIQNLTAQLEAKNERSNRLSGRNKPSLQLNDVGSSVMDKIHATIATNSCLIKHERSRLELISQMAGIPLNGSPSMKLKYPQLNSQKSPSLGGSAISIDREQRDALFYRLLSSTDTNSKLKGTRRKTTTSTVDNRIPIAKASSAVIEVIASIRKLEDAEAKTPMQSTPKKQTSTIKSREKASSPTSSLLTAKLPVTAKQMSSPGKQKNQEISKLLASAESVPPVTLAGGSSRSKASGFSYTLATDDAVSVSVALPRTAGKSQPSDGTSKPSVFVPSASRSLTSPTRATTTTAPTTKILGAPKGNFGNDNFKPLSPQLPSSLSADELASSAISPKSPDSVPKAAVAQSFPAITKSSSASSISTVSVVATIPSSSLFGMKPTAASESSKIPFASIAFPPTVSANEPVALGTPAATSAPEPLKNIFGTAIAATTLTSQPPPTFGTIATTVAGILATSTISAKPTSLFGGIFTTAPSTTQSTPIFETATTTSTTQSIPIFGEFANYLQFAINWEWFTATAPSASTPSAPLSAPIFGTAPSTTTTPSITQSTSIFGGTSVATATSGQSGSVFGSPITTSTAASSLLSETTVTTTTVVTSQPTSPFGAPILKPSTVSTASSPGSIFGQSVTSTIGQPSSIFGKPIISSPASTGGLFGQALTTVPTSSSGGLFGQAVPITTTVSSSGLFGQNPPTAGGLFGQATTQSMGLFSQPTLPISTQAGGLFSNIQGSNAPPQTGSLFGSSPKTGQASGGLFGQPAPATAGPSGGLFARSATTNTSGLFGQSTSPTGGLFGQSAGSTVQSSAGGLFAQPVINTGAAVGGLFGQSTTTTPAPATQAGGLFGSSPAGGGLFGSPKPSEDTGLQNVSSLFATANFGLGSTPTTPSIFQKPSTPPTTGQTQGLFGSSISTATANKPGGIFGQSTLSGPGLFGSSSTSGGGLFSAAGSSSGGLFSSSTTGQSTATSGSLFGASAFGSTSNSPAAGGLFSSISAGGAPGFGAPPVFGGSAFPSASGPGSSILGTATTTGAGGLFASLGSSSGGPTFAGLANSAAQKPNTLIFGTSPAFTQRRAPVDSPPESKKARKDLEEDLPPDFYSRAAEYWDNTDATEKGMLGGLTRVHKPDINGSLSILERFGPSRKEIALDCGAGIGRVTKHLLLPRFKTVDMVELTQKFLDASKEYIGEEGNKRIGNRFCSALQDFTPPKSRYDVIWVQWVIGHLAIPAAIDFFRRCVAGLRPADPADEHRSIIVLKDNVTSLDAPDFDEVDSSFMRTHEELLRIFEEAELKVLLDEKQNMPKNICPVYAFVLIPNDG